MKILKSWLNDWIELDQISDEELSNALESLGLKVSNNFTRQTKHLLSSTVCLFRRLPLRVFNVLDQRESLRSASEPFNGL